MNDMSTPSRQPYLVVDSPYEVANWRPLANVFLYIPHAIVSGALQTLSRAAFFVNWLALIFTGKLYPGLYGMMVMYERYNARASGFLVGFSETYPPFDFSTEPDDNGAYPPIRLRLPAMPDAVPRSAALNVFKAIPHYIVLMVFYVGAFFVALFGWFAVLFTGHWPEGGRAFLVRVSNYQYRIWTYVAMVDNEYPAFGLPDA